MIIGIDPGKSGGIAVIDRNGIAAAHKMPATIGDLWDLIHEIKASNKTRERRSGFAYLEKVHAMPRQGVVSTFTFGHGFGALEMALTAAGIPYELVTPNKWMKAMGCQTGGDKNVTKAAAQRLFPELTITHAIADALLIAEYGRRNR